MDYPADCLDRLLAVLKDNDQDGPNYADENQRNRRLSSPHPTRDQLREILDVAHAGSLQPEEGRLPQFALAFVPRTVTGKGYDVHTFAKAKPLNAKTVGKLAPAANPNRTFLGVDVDAGGDLVIWGLIHDRRNQRFNTHEDARSGFLPNHVCLIVRVHGPGVFFVRWPQPSLT